MGVLPDSRDSILDAALAFAEEKSWEHLRLGDIADRLKISLNDIREYYPQKDDLVEAWFDRADAAMLESAAQEYLQGLSERERLHRIVMSWLDELAVHKKVTGDMLLYKLEPAHIHLQVQGVLRISRTVQWMREAAGMSSTHIRRIAEEIGLTSIYLATFAYWITDRSPRQQRTSEFLQQRLRHAESCLLRVEGLHQKGPLNRDRVQAGQE